MRDDKALELFNKILEKTRQGVLAWQATAEPEEYFVPLAEKRYIQIYPFTEIDESGNRKGPISVSLHDENKQILVDMTVNVDGISLENLKELNTAAQRTALKIDRQVDDVLKELDDIIPF